MELELNLQNQEIQKTNNKEKQNNLENNNVELLVEQEVTAENQNNFLQTTLGKTINTAIDIGLRAILPDMIEEQVIDIKNVLFNFSICSFCIFNSNSIIFPPFISYLL